MALNEVMQAGEFGFFEKIGMFFETLSLFHYCLLGIFIIIIWILMIQSEMIDKWFVSFGISATAISLVICIGAQYAYTEGEKVQNWKKDYVVPYVESLPVEKYTIQSFNPISKETVEDTYTIEPKFYYKDVSETDLVLANIVYTNGEEKAGTQKDMYVYVIYDLKEGDKPYMEMKHLETDLGNNVDAGYINSIVHLPDNYTLNYQ